MLGSASYIIAFVTVFAAKPAFAEHLEKDKCSFDTVYMSQGISSNSFLLKDSSRIRKRHWPNQYNRESSEFWLCARINYIQGRYGYLGVAIPFTWNDIRDAPIPHIGFAAGIDLRLSKTLIYAPKFVVEAQIFPAIIRVGYQYYSDSDSHFDNRFLCVIGL